MQNLPLHRRPVLLAILFALLVLLVSPYVLAKSADEAVPSSAQATATQLVPIVKNPAVPRVYTGVYLHDVSNFSLGEGTYEIDADMWVKWIGDFDPREIRIANGSDVELTPVGADRDGDWHSVRWRIRGTMRGDFPVHDFPLDQQAITVQIELARARGELVPDLAGSGVANRFSITDWIWAQEFRPVVSTVRYPSDLGSISAEGRSAEIRRVSFEVSLERPLMPVILKLFLPLAVVALIVFLSLFVPPDSLQPRLTMCVTGLVACFAFQFSVSDVMPAVAYLTLADTLFITVYVLAIFCVIIAVIGHVLQANQQKDRAMKIQRIARIIAPIAMAISVCMALPSRALPEAPPAPQVEQLERQASSRDHVRIGTTMPVRLATSPAGFASYWGLTYAPPVGFPRALQVEHMPRIDTGGMRFLSDGSLVVTWRLRDDARWSDGTPMHTDDILLPLALRPDPRVLHMEALDDRTVALTWNERMVDALRAPLAWPTTHMRAAIDPNDADALRDYLSNALRPSTGPYMPVELTEDRIVAVRNPYFTLAPASIERIEVRYYADSEALRDALLRGEVDISTPNALSPEDFQHFETQTQLAMAQAPSPGLVFLAGSLTAAPWDNLEARRALVQAIDRQALAESEWGDAGRVAHAPTMGDLAADFPTVSYDPDAARATFEALGLTGAEIKLRWSTPFSEAFVTRIAAALEAAGLSPQLERVPSTWPFWMRQDFDGLLLHQLRVDASASPAQWWALPSKSGRYLTDTRHSAWTDAICALLDQYDHALFQERRLQLRARIEQQWAEALPLMPLVFAGERVVVDAELQGWKNAPDAAFGRAIDTWFFATETSNEAN